MVLCVTVIREGWVGTSMGRGRQAVAESARPLTSNFRGLRCDWLVAWTAFWNEGHHPALPDLGGDALQGLLPWTVHLQHPL